MHRLTCSVRLRQNDYVQKGSNWPTDLFHFETLAVQSGDYRCLMSCGAAATWLNLQISPITQSYHFSTSKQNKPKGRKTHLGCPFNKTYSIILLHLIPQEGQTEAGIEIFKRVHDIRY